MNEQSQENQKSLEMQLKKYKKEINLVRQKNEEYISLVKHLKGLLTEKDQEDIKGKEEKQRTGNSKKNEQDVMSLQEQIIQIHTDMGVLREDMKKINELIKNDCGRILANQSQQQRDPHNVTFRDIQNATEVKAGSNQGRRNLAPSDHKNYPNQPLHSDFKMTGSYWARNETLESNELENKDTKNDSSVFEDTNVRQERPNKGGNRLLSLLKWKF